VKKFAEDHEAATYLKLNDPRITEIWPLQGLKKLRTLIISGTGVEHCPITLIGCPELVNLDVQNTKVHTTTLARIIYATKVTLDTLKVGAPGSTPNVNVDLLRHLVECGYGQKIDAMLARVHSSVGLPCERVGWGSAWLDEWGDTCDPLDIGNKSHAVGTLLLAPKNEGGDIAMIVDTAGKSLINREIVEISAVHGKVVVHELRESKSTFSKVLEPEHWVCPGFRNVRYSSINVPPPLVSYVRCVLRM